MRIYTQSILSIKSGDKIQFLLFLFLLFILFPHFESFCALFGGNQKEHELFWKSRHKKFMT